MKKLLRNRNVLLLLFLLVVILAVLLAGKFLNTTPETLPDLPEAQSETPAEMPLGYILARANDESKWIPLPTGEEDLYISITRQDEPAVSNTLRLFKNGFVMDSSTCDNQDCVMQGEVTLENKSDRVLMHMVICLPHNVSAELYSTEELALILAENAQKTP